MLTLVNLWHRAAKKERLRRDIGYYLSKRKVVRLKSFYLSLMLKTVKRMKGFRLLQRAADQNQKSQVI